jgi:hypothetical protein
MRDFEKLFEDFLLSKDYDYGENVLFSMLRTAFTSGWIAAGCEPPEPLSKADAQAKPE